MWVTLTRPLDERALYSEAARHGVTFTPGGAVTAERRSQTSLRLSFSLLEPEELDEGVRRLARAIREVRRRAAARGGRRADLLSSRGRPATRRSFAARAPPSERSSSRVKWLRKRRRTPSRCVTRARSKSARPRGVITA